MKIRLRGKSRRCPLCRVRHAEGEPVYTCSGCEVRYHEDCAKELGGCSTLGCKRLGLGPDEATPEAEGRGTRIRRGLRASRGRRRERRRMTEAHRETRTNSGQRSSFFSDSSWDFGMDIGCCCALGILEILAGVVLVGVLLFPPGVRVAKAPALPDTSAPAKAPEAPATPDPEDRPL